MRTGQSALQLREKTVLRNGSQETQPAQIYREQRNGTTSHGSCSRKQRAVATQHNRQLAAFRNVRAIKPYQHAGVVRRLIVETRINSPRMQPGENFRHQLLGRW